MRSLLFTLSLLLCLGKLPLAAQSPINQLQQRVDAAKRPATDSLTPLFSRSNRGGGVPSAAFRANQSPQVLQLDQQQLAQLTNERPALLSFAIPTETEAIVLELVPVELFSATGKLLVGTSGGTIELPFERGLHYQGVVKGKPNSVVAVSITDGTLAGLIADETGNYSLNALKNNPSTYLFYNDRNLAAQRAFTCDTPDTTRAAISNVEAPLSINCRVANIYFEADYKLYQDNGSNTTQTANYVANLFNQVAVLYARENIAVRVAGLKVWATPDPYTSLTTTSDVLSAFRTNQNSSPPPGISSNLSHFLSGRSLGGGIAYLDVLCGSSYRYGVSASLTTTYTEFPNYSWEVMVVTHELGHNFGSPHTHSCTWPGGAIDNCYTTEGGCAPGPAPTNGGTIMSYCHLTSAGINFANGFGPLPGNRLRDRVTSCSSLSVANDVPTSLANKTPRATATTLYWVSNAGSTQFTLQYRLSSGSSWTTVGPIAGPQYDLTGLQTTTAYTWRVTGECSGTYSAESSFTTGVGAYCTPVYTNNGCGFGIGLKRVVVNGTTLTANSGCAANYYTYYPTPVASVSLSAANTFTVEFLGTFNAQQFAIWIDVNQSFEFEPGERVYGTPTSATAPVSSTFTLPVGTQAGQTYRMRIRNQFSSSVTAPCAALGYGETEDYLVYVVPPCGPTMTSVKSGSWNDPATWSCQSLPSATTALTIRSGDVITLPANYQATVRSLQMRGQLRYLSNAQLKISP
ncbi:M12 family metallo-peptidase [Fibrella aquatilis]|uniref:Fibronectin type-III domain-containing protein n=1 Tax=Fibrella aquatilis TaxID=2817059 RepID=A0A939JY09_9BACT|nr:M12 family metallo-peptidase [Fibrella aquatilis]MBO0929858.1 hypothetical protein [Fibrella aquatilis]